MKIRSTVLLSALAGSAFAAVPGNDVPVALSPLAPDAVLACGTACAHSAMMAAGERFIAAHTFWALPESHRAQVAKGLEERGEPIPVFEQPAAEDVHPALSERAVPLTEAELDEAHAKLSDLVERDRFERFTPVQQRMLSNFFDLAQEPGRVPVMPCFTPGVDPDYMMLFEEIVSLSVQNDGGFNFEQTGRWGRTALDLNGGGQGNPTILTYSFPPDGTVVPSGVGEPSGPNDLNAFLDGIYGNRNTWRAIYDQIFQRWADVSGNTYILEPNDDGASLDFTGSDSSPGVSGVRGDLRMTGKPIDGNSGTLAYNFFPQVGDMVIDTADNFYFNTTGQSLRLRNILLHEHGHGMGQLHTCPITQSKLMEPFISLAFDGPQFDDILNAQRHYGDPNEPNDSAGSPTDVGTFGVDEGTTVELVSLDDDTDVDWYRFEISEASQVRVTLRPQGELYQAGPQTQNCNEQQPYNPLLFLDPSVEIRSANGSTVLASANSNGLGEDEEAFASLNAGTYVVRASASNPSGDQIIAYELDINAAFNGLVFEQAGTIPASVAPGTSIVVDVELILNNEGLNGDPFALYRTDGGAFATLPVQDLGGGIYRATFPATSCGEVPEFRFGANGTVTGPQFFPSGDPFRVAVLNDVDELVDDAQTDIGWTVSGDATEGQWERGVPQNNGRDDPPADFDGSGNAWLTGQEPNDDNSDVDGGSTILTSPEFDFSDGGTIGYAYWAQDEVNPIGAGDGFFVEFSTNNGATWTRIRSYTTAGFWRQDTIDVTSEIGTPSSLRVRFVATDNDPGDVLECGVDAIVFTRNVCDDVPVDACNAADVATPLGVLDLNDVDAFIAAFNTAGSLADIAAPFGVIDLGDIDAFIAAFQAGCP